jgi:hypothetical protein
VHQRNIMTAQFHSSYPNATAKNAIGVDFIRIHSEVLELAQLFKQGVANTKHLLQAIEDLDDRNCAFNHAIHEMCRPMPVHLEQEDWDAHDAAWDRDVVAAIKTYLGSDQHGYAVYASAEVEKEDVECGWNQLVYPDDAEKA